MSGHVFGKFIFAAIAVLLAAPVALAFSFSSSSYNLGITTVSDGKAFVYATNPFSQDGTLSFTASSGQLNAYFDSAAQAIAGGATRGTYVHVSSPQCFKGVQDIAVYAQLCVGGDCKVESLTIRVNIAPASDCSGYVYLSNGTEAYYVPAAPRTSDGTVPLSSGIYFSSQYDPSYYELDIFGKDELDLRQGDYATVELSLANRGAAGTFDLRLIGDKGELEGHLSDDYVSLSRGEERLVRLDVQPSTITGKYCAAVQALHGGVIVQEKYVCFNVYDKLAATIKLPSSIAATRCDAVKFEATVQNTGTAQDTYHFKAKPYAIVSEPYLTLTSGESGDVIVTVDANSLALGRNDVTLYAEGETTDALTGLTSKGSGTVGILVSDCPQAIATPAAPASISTVNTTQTANGTLIKVVAQAFNDGEDILEEVTADITGLPEGWKVTQQEPMGVSVLPNQTKNLTLWVQAGGPEEAEALLQIKSRGTAIYSKPIRINGSTGDFGILGFFTLALSSNSLFIAVLILAALVVIVMSARKRHANELEAARLDKVKKSISEY